MPEAPNTLVLLASEQLWPNLHSIEHWGPGLDRVLIYHTDDGPRSAEPARRLAAFCERRRRQVPGLRYTAHPVRGGATPEAVAGQLAAWRETHADGGWMINATGGTKLMFAGVAGFCGRPGVRVVYRELGPEHAWYELGRDAHGTPTAARIDDIPVQGTDGIPVQTLIDTLWASKDLPVSSDIPADLPDVALLTRKVIETRDWVSAFRAAGWHSDRERAGPLFELYVVAALRALGVRNLAWSAVQKGLRPPDRPGDAQTVQEVDVVANHVGQLFVFDCKLRTKEEEALEVEKITSQIRQAAQTVRRLGGSGAAVLLIRPNRELSEAEQALARDLRVEVIHRPDMGNLFARIARFVGCALPDPLREADALLARHENLVAAFPASAAARRAVRTSVSGPVFHLEQFLGEWSREFRQDWAVTQVRHNLYYLQSSVPVGWTKTAVEDALARVVDPFGRVLMLQVAESGNTLYAFLEIDDRRSFLAYLDARTGKSLF